MRHSLIIGFLCSVTIVGLGAGAAGDAPPAEITFTAPSFLPPIIIRPADADVNGDGRVTVDDVKILYAPSDEIAKNFIHSFYGKLLKAGKQYRPEWHGVEVSRKNVRDLAVVMVGGVLDLESEKKAGKAPVGAVCVLTYWAGEKVSGWSTLSESDLEQIKVGKARFSIDEHSQHWGLVYGLTVPVWLGRNVS